ncbi:MFS transporter [Paratractidigestivibacter sp.]|uniref:MFS transporter n=1 Tax=Paratractidigestivibacter sp. TaxID=2847316 RepID=UPI002ABD206E|nr:MFS transporter [Paratractidigestivibacter sp.]
MSTQDTTIDPNTIAPDTGKPMSKSDTLRFMVGFIIFGIMWMMSGTIGSNVLFPERFNNLNIGMSGETILATMNTVGMVFALVSNLVFGALSDHCHSRFGKRTPFVIVGGFICGIAFWLTANAESLATIVAFWCLLQIGLNCMLAPAVAILSDRIPLNKRGTLSAFYGGGSTVGQSVGTIIGTQFLTNPVPGFVIGTVAWFCTGVLAIIIWPKEKSAALAEGETAEKLELKSLLMMFVPPTKNCRDFYLALFGRLLLIFGYFCINGYQLYILEKYIGLGTVEAGTVLASMSVLIMIVSFVASLTSGAISDKIGARKPIILVATILMCVGVAAPWLLKSVFGMYGFALCAGLGYGIYSSVDQALNIDVLPNKEEAGKDLGILNMANTIGQILGPLVTSSIVVATGSYFLTFPISIVLMAVGFIFVMMIKSAK